MAGSGRRVAGGKKRTSPKRHAPPTRHPLPATRWEGGWYVVRAECDFHHQLGMEPIEIGVRIGDMRTTSFDTHYEIRTVNGRQLAATGKVVVVVFDWKSQSKTPITDELRDKVRLFQKGAE